MDNRGLYRPSTARRRAIQVGLALALTASAGPGCTREFFRNWADQDVTEVVFEKSRDPMFRFDMFTIEPPAMSRFANPYDKDRPPAPPDDPAAQALAPVPQWSHHRLMSPVEGTGYLDLLEQWRRERPIKRPVDVGADMGPSGTPADLAPPPSSSIPAPFAPPRNSRTVTPPLSPIPEGGPDEIAPPDPRGEGESTPDIPPPRLNPSPENSQTQSRKPVQDRDVLAAAYQVPETDIPAPAQPSRPPDLPPEVIAGETADVPVTSEADLIEILKPQEVAFDEGLAAGVPPEVDPYIIDGRQALTLALQNSRAYQFNLEDVYLRALDVTLQRFSFEPQFFAGLQPGVPTAGGLISPNPGTSYIYRTNEAAGGYQSLLNVGTAAGFGKLLSVGTRVAGGFANQLIIDFGGPEAVQTRSQSFLPLAISQAFLRGGGRAVTLEPLTQAERTLLYQVRSFTQFRREFFVSVLAGGGVTGGGGDPAIGFLQVLLQQQIVENNTKNVAAFERVLEVFQELGVGAGSSVAPLDIVNVELQLQTQRNALVSSLNGYRNQLDSYKIQLGMPPDVPVIPDSSLLKGFREIFDEIDQLTSKPRPTLDRLVDKLPALEDVIIDGRPVIGAFGEAAESIKERRPYEQRIIERQLIVGRINRLREDLENQIRTGELTPEQIAVRQQQLDAEQRALVELGGDDESDRAKVQQQLQFERELLVKANKDLEPTLRAAERVALENRVDLMNARAQVYDAWRQIAVRANALQGVFNLAFSNQYLTPPTTNNPFGFDDQAKQFSLTLNAELPLIRLTERNQYIAAVIQYERQRRTLMQAEDQIKNQIRQDIRNLQLSYQNYEINKRRYVASLVTQDQSFQRFLEPPRAGGGGATTGGTLVLSLINALSGVLQSQNGLIQFWVSYQTQRLSLYRDLGIMPYDEWEAFYELFPAASQSSTNAPAGDPGPPPVAVNP